MKENLSRYKVLQMCHYAGIEFQIIGSGNFPTVHTFQRDCLGEINKADKSIT